MILCDGRKPLVCIDPGHGGRDPGAVGPSGTREADVVLSISKEVAAELEVMGIETVLTRDDDTYVHLHERTALAEEADCLISIHCNAFRSPHAEGVLTLYGAPGGRNKALANYVQKSLMKHMKGHRDRNIVMSPSKSYPQRLFVLGNSPCPSALVETEFISNPKQEAWLKDTDSHQTIAHAIARGVRSFIRSLPYSIESEDDQEEGYTSALGMVPRNETHDETPIELKED